MARKHAPSASGTLVVLEHTSRVLAGNPLGDPHVRKVAVWLPPQYDEGATHKSGGRGRRFPVLYDLVCFTGSGIAHTNWKPFGDNVPERAARLVRERKMGPAIFVFPDCFTSLGGNQYVNSSAIGAYADYLTGDHPVRRSRVPHARLARASRLLRQPSGGYGAIIHGMKYAKHWGAIADHSGDAYFDVVYHHDWANTLNEPRNTASRSAGRRLRRAGRNAARKGLAQGYDDGRVQGFLDAVGNKEKLSPAEGHAIMNVCMAATYDPDPKAPLGFRLPFHLETGERLDARWKKWLQHDPIHLVRKHAASLRSLKGIYIDCGWRDQYHIHYGTRQLSLRLAEAGIRHRYEEFDDNHWTSTTGWT
jgi:enterochelin esterase-like enzyme